jgi:hypothetical protein
MKKFNKNIAFLSFYGICLWGAILLSGSSEQNPTEVKKTNKIEVDTIELVLDRILKLEGAHTFCIGDSGRSFGCFQITKDCLKDVNRRSGTNYTHSMMFDSIKARKVAKEYIFIGNENYRRKEGKEPTIEVMLRNYNGGAYSGYKNPKTKRYSK